MSMQFKTMKDMLAHFYGSKQVMKADAPVLTSTTGVYNPIFGAQAYSQLNNEANAFSLLPKYPWQYSGFRVITADPTSSANGGVAENGAVPDTIKPTFAEVTITTKQHAHTFESSYIQDGKVKKGDDAIGDMDFLRGYFATFHAKDINAAMLLDGDTLAGTRFESIDRITASAALATAMSWTSADEDIYGIDRSANAWADAVVDHNSGTDRILTDTLITSTLGTLEANGGRPTMILTGSDTKWRIIDLFQNQVRYPGVVSETSYSVGINGVETDSGLSAGKRIATVYGIPLMKSQHVVKDTISRIYILDTTINEETGIPRLGISLMYPTLYFESGMSAANPDPFAIGTFGTKGAYYTAGEVVCTFFKAQASIRDLK